MSSGAKKNGPARRVTTQRDRFLIGTDTPVIRVKSYRGGKSRMVWAVKEESGGYRHVPAGDTELRP